MGPVAQRHADAGRHGALGLPIAPAARYPVYFLVEGRVFLDSIDEVDNNYQFWGGIRVRF